MTEGEKGHKIHIINPEIASHIKKMFEFYSTGNYSIKKLSDVMYSEGLRNKKGKKIGKSIMHSLLTDPFYYGKMRWNNEIYDGKQEPIITKELFYIVQEKITRTIKQPQYQKHLYTFKGMMICGECGGTITWEKQKGIIYGHCNHYKSCTQKKYITEAETENLLLPRLKDVAPKNERVLKWLKKALKENHAEEIEYNQSKREKYNQIIIQMDKRLEVIYDDKIDDKITAEFYEKKYNEYNKTKEDTLNELDKLHQDRSKYYEAGFAIHELASNAMAIYKSEKATIEDRRLLLSYTFSNHTLKDLKLEPNYTLAFEFLKEWIPKLNKTFELQENSLNKTKTDAFTSARSVLLPGSDSNRRPIG
ncbi:hypothetical protein COV49_00215 [Candidatus Falkowbacteria bacterium CG11_big_fil_rev_8_21_14_0_20_39_10]|uniref:Recombinase domain-containing protein n=1 Tax=Candidatus Falkowbacteria bacterium CG11_big_fil_rev_8_21_14_0_20_39_10 TaxID=1974570 RepID=A0A2M6KA71_9BACT|nr:MAG: hypothetical protein COV49_00215 [Candidatus Falkowbacteria bacterium CG11_big_fil_rev_8_21_14_0_20_39_10]